MLFIFFSELFFMYSDYSGESSLEDCSSCVSGASVLTGPHCADTLHLVQKGIRTKTCTIVRSLPQERDRGH